MSQNIQEPVIEQDRVLAENEDSETIYEQNDSSNDGNTPMEDVKYEATCDDDDNMQTSDNIECHNAQGLFNTQYINKYDDMIDIIKNETYTLHDVKDVSEMADNVGSETTAGASNVEKSRAPSDVRKSQAISDVKKRQASSDEVIPLQRLRPRKRVTLNEDKENSLNTKTKRSCGSKSKLLNYAPPPPTSKTTKTKRSRGSDSLNTKTKRSRGSKSKTPAAAAAEASSSSEIRESESKPPATAAAVASSSSEICESDLPSDKPTDILYELLQKMSDNEDDMDDVAASIDFMDYACLNPAQPTITDPEQVAWLEREDFISDRLLEDMLPVDNLTFDWTNDPNAFTGRRHDLTGKSGPTFKINDKTRPIDVFSNFFTDDFLDMIVRETNKQATFMTNRDLKTKSRLNFWKDVDRDEIAIFFSILILQGMACLTVEKDYWRENGYLTMTRFRRLMTYNRFILIKRLLHFTDDRTTTDRLRKIKPVLDHLNERFSTLYLPGRDIAIDESLLKWHDRLTFAQKIATKAKVGMKSYELCESSTGYLWKFFIDPGKGQTDQTDTEHTRQTDMKQTRQTDETGQTAPPPPTNTPASIVIDLVKPLFNRGHTLTLDNFHNSPLLARYLKSNGTDCFGYLRVNRKFVPDSIKSVSEEELRVGEIVQSYCRDLSIMVCRDTDMVSMLSTFHKGEVGGTDGWYKKPQAILDYNLSMGGIDEKNQLLSAHLMERSRSEAWYKKAFRRLLNVTLLNSHVIFKTHFKTVSEHEFRDRLVNEIVQKYKKPGIEVLMRDETNLSMSERNFQRPIVSGNHFIGVGRSKNSRCVWCRKGRSKYICKQCDVALCVLPCFEEFHTLQDRPSRCLPSQ